MTSEESIDLQGLFEAADQLEGRERSAFIEALRELSPSLACDVEELLEVAEEGGPIADDEGPSHAERLARALASAEQMDTEIGTAASLLLKRFLQERPDSATGPGKRAAADYDPSQPLLDRLARRVDASLRYDVREEIARGGMGRILDVWDRDLRRGLAMKMIRASREDDEGRTLARFLEEAQVTAQLDHPGVVSVHEVGLDETGRVYFTMSKVPGRDLAAVFEQVKRGEEGWSRTRALGVIQKVCETMAYAHAKGVVHRDLKPENVMVGAFGEVYVMDWGLAKVLGEEPDRVTMPRRGPALARVATDRADQSRGGSSSAVVTMAGTVVGTPSYMPPEQALGAADGLDARADVYAIGAMLYELLAGSRPYQPPGSSTHAVAVVRLVQQGPPQRVEALARDLPPELVAICEKAMARSPADRYADTMEMAEDVRAYLENRVVRAYRTGALVEFRKWVSRNRGMAAAILVALVVLVLGSSGVALSESKRRVAAEENRDRVLRMSDVKILRELVEEEKTLWPPLPPMVDALAGWLTRARAVLGRLPEHEESRQRLAVAETPLGAAGDFDASSLALQAKEWQLVTLDQIVTESKALPPLIADVERRLAFATGIEALTVTGPDAAARWRAATDAIASLERYGGLELAPQLGLLPLREDPDSGLWEFLHVQSGEPPETDADGRWIVTEATGVVLVLVPGGEATIGSYAPSREHPAGEPFVDPFHGPRDVDENPRRVVLEPYFIAKYEMTQAQWERIMGGSNPSQHQGEPRSGPAHPVENVSWFDCEEALARMDLALPTEAQFEYACRAGTATPWATGSDVESLEGFSNVADRSFVEAGQTNGNFHTTAFADGFAIHAPVGSFWPNELGLHDMHGNVWEWCRDDYDVAGSLRAGDGLRGDEPGTSVKGTIRGGSWFTGPMDARSSNRFAVTRNITDGDLGLRPVRPLDP